MAREDTFPIPLKYTKVGCHSEPVEEPFLMVKNKKIFVLRRVQDDNFFVFSQVPLYFSEFFAVKVRVTPNLNFQIRFL